MLLILEEPKKSEQLDILAINIFPQDNIVIHKISKTVFELGFYKTLDGHRSNHSALFHPIKAFKTHEEAMAFFDRIIAMVKAGENVFDLREETDISAQLRDMS